MIPVSRKLTWQFRQPRYGNYEDARGKCYWCHANNVERFYRFFSDYPGTMDIAMCNSCLKTHADEYDADSLKEWELNYQLQLVIPNDTSI